MFAYFTNYDSLNKTTVELYTEHDFVGVQNFYGSDIEDRLTRASMWCENRGATILGNFNV